MKWLAFLPVLLLLGACGGTTGDVVADTHLDQIAQLEQRIGICTNETIKLQDDLGIAQSELTATNEKIAELEAATANLQKTIDQQKQVLKQLDTERSAAVAEKEASDAKVADLTKKTDVLQKWVDACKEVLDGFTTE